jgi:uncharacterized small protein (TIGR04563 family)
MENGQSKCSNRKQSLYFPEAMLDEMKAEAKRIDRTLSWVVQKAWKLAREGMLKMPSSTWPTNRTVSKNGETE